MKQSLGELPTAEILVECQSRATCFSIIEFYFDEAQNFVNPSQFKSQRVFSSSYPVQKNKRNQLSTSSLRKVDGTVSSDFFLKNGKKMSPKIQPPLQL